MNSSSSLSGRRPHAGRPREFDMTRVLNAAVTVFRERGFNGTSIADLRTATGLTSGSIYKAFKDKHGMFVAALDHYIKTNDAALAGYLDGARDGREKILVTLRRYADVAHGVEGRRGCMVLGGMTDMDTFDEALADRFRQALSRLEQRFARFVEEGIQDASLPAHLDAASSAQYLSCVVEGLRVLGKRGIDKREAEAIVQQAVKALG